MYEHMPLEGPDVLDIADNILVFYNYKTFFKDLGVVGSIGYAPLSEEIALVPTHYPK